jgi:hypothetical protein
MENSAYRQDQQKYYAESNEAAQKLESIGNHPDIVAYEKTHGHWSRMR